MRFHTLFATVLIGICGATTVHSASQTMNYQATLISGGSPVTATVNVSFRIYDADIGGTLLWEEMRSVTPNANGLLSIRLGEVSPIVDSVFRGDDRWLAVEVESNGEMVPRTPLAGTPYAHRVATLDGATGGELNGPLVIADGGTKFAQASGDATAILVNAAGDSLILTPLTIVMKDNLGYEQFRVDNDPGAGATLGIRLDGTESSSHTAVTSTWSATAAKSPQAQSKKAQIGSQGMFLYGNTDTDTIVTVIEESSGVPEVRLTDQNAVAAAETKTIQIGGQNAGENVIVSVIDAVGNKITETVVDANGSAELVFYDVSAAKANAPSPKKMAFNKDGLLIFGATDTDTALIIQSETGNIFGRGQVAMGQQAGLGSNKQSPQSPTAIWSTVFGFNNIASGDSSTVSGGYQNVASGFASTIGGGAENVSAGQQSTVGGGWACTTNGYVTTVGGGYLNSATGIAATVAGGHTNTALEYYAAIGGGVVNTAAGWATVAGGGWNDALGYGSAVGGGNYNKATGYSSTIAGGNYNKGRGSYSTVSGGGGPLEADSNSAYGVASMIPGGQGNVATGNYSFAAGRRAKAFHGGSFVWSDSTDADFTSTLPNQFRIQAENGISGTVNNASYGASFNNGGDGDGVRTVTNVSKGNLWGALWAYNNGTGPAIVGEANDSNLAAYFEGDVTISGTVSKGAGTFRIDHPLDPENKYLSHSFVESPDMMNIYNGNVTTDGGGYAVVTMPDYFTALNRDFRYQLTAIGEFAQAIVAEKISGNTFTIRTDKPNVEVSWQVTGVRQDAYAEANRVQVETDKPLKERGTYLHPKAFGLSKTRGANGAAKAEMISAIR